MFEKIAGAAIAAMIVVLLVLSTACVPHTSVIEDYLFSGPICAPSHVRGSGCSAITVCIATPSEVWYVAHGTESRHCDNSADRDCLNLAFRDAFVLSCGGVP